MKTFTIEDINKVVNGSIAGTTAHHIGGAEHIKYAKEDQITFIGDKKYIPLWERSKATVALIDEKIRVLIAARALLLNGAKNVKLVAVRCTQKITVKF